MSEWDTDPVEENILFNDDPRLIVDMLKRDWSLGVEDTPTITCVPAEFMSSARVAMIYVYQISRYNSVSTVDYAALQRTSFLAIRLNTGFRPQFYKYMQEIYRILMSNRRVGADDLNGYTYFEVINDRIANDQSGWYTCTLDIKMTSYAYPIRSAGFGDRINRMIENNNDN
jgi:hypothetical protein